MTTSITIVLIGMVITTAIVIRSVFEQAGSSLFATFSAETSVLITPLVLRVLFDRWPSTVQPASG